MPHVSHLHMLIPENVQELVNFDVRIRVPMDGLLFLRPLSMQLILHFHPQGESRLSSELHGTLPIVRLVHALVHLPQLQLSHVYIHRLQADEKSLQHALLLLSNLRIQRMYHHRHGYHHEEAYRSSQLPSQIHEPQTRYFFHRNFRERSLYLLCSLCCLMKKGLQIHPRRMEYVFLILELQLDLLHEKPLLGYQIHTKVILLSSLHESFLQSCLRILLQVLDKLVYSLRIMFSIHYSHSRLFELTIYQNGVALLLALQMGHNPIRSLLLLLQCRQVLKEHRELC